jgi:hypothetical protein
VKAFNELKEALMTTAYTGIPQFNEDFIRTTDASDYAAGAILSQIRDGKEVVIAYRGRKFHEPERNYNTTEIEYLAVLIGLREFEPYLRGRHVTIYTDHESLKWILTRKHPPGPLVRWLAVIKFHGNT